MTAPALARPGPSSAALTRAIRRDSLWLFSGYATTAAVGFIFWIIAALRVPAAVLGMEAAIVSVFTAAAAVTASGLGSATLVILPVAGDQRPAMLRRVYLMTAVVALAGGTVAGVATAVSLRLSGQDAFALALGIAVMSVVWAAFNLQDQVLTGLNRARWTLFLNGPANAAKLVLTVLLTIPALAIGHPVVLATILPAAATVLLTVFVLLPRFLRDPVAPRPVDLTTLLRGVQRFALRDTAAIGVLMGVSLLTPFIVTLGAGPAEGALYALAFQISIALDLVVSGVATSLAKNASTDHDAGVRLSLRLWAQTLALVVPAALVVTALTPAAFALLGRGYEPERATLVVGVLAAGCIIRSPYPIWSSLMRARQVVTPVLLANSATAATLLVLLVLLVPSAGAVGAAGAVLGSAVCAGGAGLVGAVGLRRRLALEPTTLEDACTP